MSQEKETKFSEARRSFLKKTSYVAPAIVTLSVLPSFASAGSGYQTDHKREALDIVDELSVKYPEEKDFWQKLRDWLLQ